MNSVKQKMITVDLPPILAIAMTLLEPDKLPNVFHEASSTKQPSFSSAHIKSQTDSLYRRLYSETSPVQ